jgi:DNA-binding response OmpR family regulator
MRVLLCEDDPNSGTVIKRALSFKAYIVDWVLDGTKAWNHLENQRVNYTLAIFDWTLPGLSGLELCKQLRKQNDPLPVLMLKEKARMEEKIIGLDAGADDFLGKPFDMPELLARLRALRRRSPQLTPPQLQVGNLIINYGTCNVFFQCPNGNNQVIPLTLKEFQLLEYFMMHPNQIVSRDQIMNQLWEIGTEPLSNVVAAQIRLLRRKLNPDGNDSLIETVYGMGYRFNLPKHEGCVAKISKVRCG